MVNRLPTLALALLLIPAGLSAQAPATDIFVLEIDGQTVGSKTRVTDRDGYDNQPKFLPDGRLVYSSLGDDGQTDIWGFDPSTGRNAVLIETSQSEYSPTPIPGRDAISVVRDYGELVQQLWAFPLDGSEPELLLPDVNPVGYHAWADEENLLLFVLGEPMTLQTAKVGPGAGTVVAESPGRALARIPGTSELSYVDRSGETWWLQAFDPSSRTARRLVETLPGREDYAWAPDGSVWMGDGSRLYRWSVGDEGWSLVADLQDEGIYDISRLAFAPGGDRLAVVGLRPPSDLEVAYGGVAGRILGAALTDREGWEKIDYLATEIGHRLSGSEGLEKAIDWAVETMEGEGLAVRKQSVMVPHWVRGEERASLVEPYERDLPILGLGNSVGTPPEGITAPVVVVRDFEELEALGREGVEGKIVVYAVEWSGYGSVVRYRSAGPSRAAALGAVAALTRSATGLSLSTPHTGALRYDEEQPKIPAAALTVEDSEWMRRMSERGHELVVRLEMDAEMLEDVESFNVIAEIPGRERPEEVVVMGGHYDSWDVGEGVHDDGAACVAAWQALRLIHGLGLKPRRTLRVVLWTNEENGLRGGRVYHEELTEQEVADHVAAIEMDGGAERPRGFGFGLLGVDYDAEEPDPVYERAFTMLEQIGRLLGPIDASEISRGGGGADIGPLMRDGVPGLGLRTVGEHYFDWHHTHADTLDKLDIENFRRAIALLGVTAYVLADMPERLVPASSD